MFDIGFSELLLIGVVALIVIGPERLPKVARMAGAWLGRLNRYVSQVKQEVEREMKLEDLRNLQQEMKDTAQKYEVMAKETAREVDEEVRHVKKEIAAAGASDAEAGETPPQAPDGTGGTETAHGPTDQKEGTKQVSGPRTATTAEPEVQAAHGGSAAAPVEHEHGPQPAKPGQPEKHDPSGPAV